MRRFTIEEHNPKQEHKDAKEALQCDICRLMYEADTGKKAPGRP